MALVWAALLLGVLVAAGKLSAQAPAQVADSFLVVGSEQTIVPTTSVYYLGSDGTCQELSNEILPPGSVGVVYAPSAAGTYQYALTPGSTMAATLTLQFPDGGQTIPIFFKSATEGMSPATFGFNSFSFFPALAEGQLLNVSNRALLRTADTAISGFVIGGKSSRPVLIRAVGPTLTSFAVSPVSPSPRFVLQDGTNSGTPGTAWHVEDNTSPGGTYGSQVYDAQGLAWIFDHAGAFPLSPTGGEVVYFGFLSPGAYTVQTTDPAATAAGGWELTEVYVLPYAD